MCVTSHPSRQKKEFEKAIRIPFALFDAGVVPHATVDRVTPLFGKDTQAVTSPLLMGMSSIFAAVS